MPRLLVVHHCPTTQVAELRDAVRDGARAAAAELAGVGGDEVEVVERAALVPDAADVLACDGIVLVTTCNFGYMSGALKHWFDTTFRELEGHTDGLPWSLVAKGSTDVTGVRRSVEPIAVGLGWRLAAAPIELEGDVTDEHLAAAADLGATLAARIAVA